MCSRHSCLSLRSVEIFYGFTDSRVIFTNWNTRSLKKQRCTEQMFVAIFKTIKPPSCKSYDVKNRFLTCPKDKIAGCWLVFEEKSSLDIES